ncbi:MAG TPA: LacI family DNA-binding transcriptional regulator [Verrucomicrobiae bacterium]|nr:LacI family DNA-binding transcriptional regulator [Verrucomicrobiae bacterium]
MLPRMHSPNRLGLQRMNGNSQERPATLRSLSAYLKLSPATVSVVINNSPAAKAIPEHTKHRILQAARKLNYRANFFARSLSLKRGYTIGVLVPELSEGYAAAIMSGIEDELLKRGYFYFVASHRGRLALIEEYPRMLIDRAVEGMILVNTPLTHTLSVPAVSISGHRRVKGLINVGVDNTKGAFLAMEHIVKLGHREIAFFKGHPGSADTTYRWNGVCRAASQMGARIRPELTLQLQRGASHPGPSVPEEGYENAQKLLATGKPFTALVAFNDISAIGAMRAFRDAGLRVPDDVSVSGFDDIQGAAYLTPRLTTVRQPLRRMGEIAADQLLTRIVNGKKSGAQQISVEPELVIRESTCKPRC